MENKANNTKEINDTQLSTHNKENKTPQTK